ncbi:MAG: hypothetical protein PW786_15835 [Arachidicoccus sp.]|nr:hypothetical protein [Arachidicoccus sp.]
MSDSIKKKGLMIVADSLLSMSSWAYTEENVNNAKNTIDLKDAGFLTLNIDLIQMGLGGNDSWSEIGEPVEKYRVPAKHYKYSFYIKPIEVTVENKLSDLAQSLKY